MCLAAFHIDPSGPYPFVCLANRDEFHHRPTAPLHRWPGTDLFAGKDLQSGGTWMGLTEQGHFALLTNVRNSALNKGNDAPSRGELVTEFLIRGVLPDWAQSSQYAGFNLITGHVQSGVVELSYVTNQKPQAGQTLQAGTHVLSNGKLNDMWPKSKALAQGLTQLMSKSPQNVDSLIHSGIELLSNQDLADDSQLPNTGVPYDWEKILSAAKIVSPMYGTRCSTVLVVTAEGNCCLTEVSFGPNGETLGPAVQFEIKLRNPCTDAHSPLNQ